MIRHTTTKYLLCAALLAGPALSLAAQETPPTPPAPPTPPSTTTVWRMETDQPKSSYIGIMVNDVSSDRMSALKLKEERGCEVTVVDHDGPAFKAGLKEHDVIVQFNGNRVEGVEELKRMLHETPPGRKVTLGIMRDGNPMNVDVTLASRMEAHTYRFVAPRVVVPPVHVDIPTIYMVYGSRAGMQVEGLTPQLGEYFGVKDGNGVLVRSVEKGSPAEAAGFKAGDVIIKAGDNKISDQGDWRNALRDFRGKKMPVTILRDRREQTVTIDVPGRESSENSFEMDMPDFDLPDLEGLNEMKALDLSEAEPLIAEMQLNLQSGEMARAMRKAQRNMQHEMQRMQRDLQLQQREMLRHRQHELDKEKDKDQNDKDNDQAPKP